PLPPARKNSKVSGSTRKCTEVLRGGALSTIAALRQKSSSSSISGASASVALVRPFALICLISSSENRVVSSFAILSYLPSNQVSCVSVPCVDDDVRRAVHLTERLNTPLARVIPGID